jgi:hypothetical protein
MKAFLSHGIKALVVGVVANIAAVSFALPIDSVDIVELNGSFANETGNVTIKKISLSFGPRAINKENVTGTIVKENDQIVIKVDELVLSLSDLGIPFTEFETATISGLNHKMTKVSLLTTAKAIQIKSGENDANVKNLSLNCNFKNPTAIKSALHRIADLCTNGDAAIDVGQAIIVSPDLNSTSEFVALLNTFLSVVVPEQNDGQTQIDNLNVVVKAHDFNLKTKISGSINVTVKGNGAIKFVVDEGKIEVNLKKVVAGIFDVTSQVFDKLEENQSDTLKVERPFIYLWL